MCSSDLLDGSTQISSLVADLRPGPLDGVGSGDLGTRNPFVAADGGDGFLYFTGWADLGYGAGSFGLWRTDGSTDACMPDGSGTCNVTTTYSTDDPNQGSEIHAITAIGGTVYFTARDSNDVNPWSTYGDAGSTGIGADLGASPAFNHVGSVLPNAAVCDISVDHDPCRALYNVGGALFNGYRYWSSAQLADEPWWSPQLELNTMSLRTPGAHLIVAPSDGHEHGTVVWDDPDPWGIYPPTTRISCDASGSYDCVEYMDQGKEVSLAATPDDGYVFVSWDDGGACVNSSANPCVIASATGTIHVKAVFDLVDSGGGGGGGGGSLTPQSLAAKINDQESPDPIELSVGTAEIGRAHV